jgi:hypothetical protein
LLASTSRAWRWLFSDSNGMRLVETVAVGLKHLQACRNQIRRTLPACHQSYSEERTEPDRYLRVERQALLYR